MCLKNGGKNSVGTFRKKELFIMKQRKIMLKTIEDAKKFVNASMKCDFDIDVFYNLPSTIFVTLQKLKRAFYRIYSCFTL